MKHFKINHVARQIWDIIIIICILFVIIDVPLRNALFSGNFNETQNLSLFYYGVWFIFLCDIFVNLNTAYYHKGEHIIDRKQIFMNYLSNWFIMDVLSVIPWEILFANSEYNLFHFSLLLKGFRLFFYIRIEFLLRFFKNSFKKIAMYVNNLKIILIIGNILIISHLIACGFIFLEGVPPNDDNVTRYIKGLYWTITTLMTIGYGDITAKNNVQMIYAIFIMGIGASMYAYIIGTVTGILNNMNMAKIKHDNKLSEIDSFLKFNQIPFEIKQRVHNYYQYIWDNRLSEYNNNILHDLPNPVQVEIARFMNRDLIMKVPMFKSASDKIIDEIVLNLKSAVYAPGEYIFREGFEGNGMYLINKGNVEVLKGPEGKLLALLSDGMFFGEIALVSNKPRGADVKARDYCELLFLEKTVFDSIIQTDKAFLNYIKEVSDKRSKENK